MPTSCGCNRYALLGAQDDNEACSNVKRPATSVALDTLKRKQRGLLDAKDTSLNSAFAQTGEGLFTLPGIFSVGRLERQSCTELLHTLVLVYHDVGGSLCHQAYVGTSSDTRVIQLSWKLRNYTFGKDM